MRAWEVRVRFRPLTWLAEGRRHPAARKPSSFRKAGAALVDELRSELALLEPTDVVLLEAGWSERHLRADGMPRADAPKQPGDPAVVLRVPSAEHGPLVYRCDAFDGTWANLRAIHLTMQAQRAIVRYEAAEAHQPYTGWQALPPGRSAGSSVVAPMTGDEARAALLLATSVYDSWPTDVQEQVRLVRIARVRSHPDTGGSVEQFDRVQRAAAVLNFR